MNSLCSAVNFVFIAVGLFGSVLVFLMVVMWASSVITITGGPAWGGDLANLLFMVVLVYLAVFVPPKESRIVMAGGCILIFLITVCVVAQITFWIKPMSDGSG